MQYRVAIYNTTTNQWEEVGPVYPDRDDAVKFMATFAATLKRVVALEGEAPTPSDAVAMAEAGLDPERIAFCRWLIRTERLTDDCEGYDEPVVVGAEQPIPAEG